MRLPFFNNNRDRLALGLHITRDSIRAVLLEHEEGAYVVVNSFYRERGMVSNKTIKEPEADFQAFLGLDDLGDDESDDSEEKEEQEDYSIEFGDFQDVEEEAFDPSAEKVTTKNIVVELTEIIQPLKKQGRVEVAFCLGSPEISYAPITAPASEKLNGKLPDKKTLLSWLNKQRKQPFDKKQVGFLPLASSKQKGQPAALAIIRAEDDPVTSSLSPLYSNRLLSLPSMRSMEGEVVTLLRVVKQSKLLKQEQKSVLVRIGGEDTLLMFFEGNQLIRQDHLSSLDVHDSPSKVASRVLLQQDEAGMDRINKVLVVADENEEAFHQQFQNAHLNAEIVSLAAALWDQNVHFPSRPDRYNNPGLWIPAIGSALRLLGEDKDTTELQAVNLLPKQFRKRKRAVLFGWHTIAMGILISLTVLFLSARYYQQQDRLESLERKIQQYPANMEQTAQHLQQQVDSLQKVYTRYDNLVQQRNSVLRGADKWSQLLSQTVNSRTFIPGIWIKDWIPQDQRVKLKGYATNRESIVNLAADLEATVNRVSFASIRDYPVYEFTMRVNLPDNLPRYTTHVRETPLLPSDN